MTKETIVAVHQILREGLFEQLRTKERIDTKISIIAGFNMLVFVLCFQLYPDVNIILFSLGMIFSVISLVLLLKSYRAGGWFFSPSPQVLIEELNEGKEIEDIYLQTIGDIGGVPDIEGKNIKNEDLGAFRINEKRMHNKVRLFNISIYILLSGLILVFFSRILFSLQLTLPPL